MSLSFSSIFNKVSLNQSRPTKIWSKPTESDIELLRQTPTSYSFQASIKTVSNSVLKQKNLKVLGNHLVCMSNTKENKIKGCLNLDSFVVSFHQNSKSSCYPNSARIIKDSNYTELFFIDQRELQKFRESISPFVILTDIHSVYKAGKQLGEGAFGKVYELFRVRDSLKFAVKAISKTKINEKPTHLQAIISEISIQRSLDHPYVVKLFEVHETANTIYLVLEFVEGTPLLDLSDIRIIPKSTRLSYLSQLAEVMQVLKDKNILHRDLKPDNILVTAEGSIKVIDFGLSLRFEDSCSQSRELRRVGTPGFLAPELIHLPLDGQYSYPVDMFALGVTYYCMVSGEHPFDGKKFQNIVDNNLAGKIDFEIPQLKALCKREFTIIKGLLEFDQLNRSTPNQLLNQIKNIVSKKPEMHSIDEFEQYLSTDEDLDSLLTKNENFQMIQSRSVVRFPKI